MSNGSSGTFAEAVTRITKVPSREHLRDIAPWEGGEIWVVETEQWYQAKMSDNGLMLFWNPAKDAGDQEPISDSFDPEEESPISATAQAAWQRARRTSTTTIS